MEGRDESSMASSNTEVLSAMGNVKDDSVKHSGQTRVPVSCSKAFDSLYFCYSPFHQGKIYYQTGELDDCRGRLKRFRMCAMSRFRPESESEKVYEEEAQTARENAAPPVWKLRPEYVERMRTVEEEERREARESGNSSSQSANGWWL